MKILFWSLVFVLVFNNATAVQHQIYIQGLPCGDGYDTIYAQVSTGDTIYVININPQAPTYKIYINNVYQYQVYTQANDTAYTYLASAPADIRFQVVSQACYADVASISLMDVSINENTFLKHQLIIFPNPAIGKYNIMLPYEFLNERELTLNIFDNTGKLIGQNTPEIIDGKIKVSLEAEARGIYNAILSNGRKTYSGKIVFE
jgi:hypothetical protein